MGSTTACSHPRPSTGATWALLGRIISVLVTAVLVASLAVAAPVGAQEVTDPDDQTTTTVAGSDGPSPAGNILPRPGSGQAPESAGDPGGWMQYLVFALIFAGLALIVLMVMRESKKAKSR